MNDEPHSRKAEAPALLSQIKNLFSRKAENREDLLKILQSADENCLIGKEAMGIIEGALQVSDLQVREFMVPKAQMASISIQDSPKDILHQVIESGHSRFPVVNPVKDEVIGVLLAKDLLPLSLEANLDNFDIHSLIRSVTFVPESKRLNVLLTEFRQTRNHMAVVIDEYGNTAGLITIEDVLEEIVGDIEDEHDDEAEHYIKALSDLSYNVSALTPIEHFNQYFDVDFNESDYDTIGGFVINTFGYLPKKNEEITIDGALHFRVLSADSRRLLHLRLTRLVTDETV